MFHTTTKQKPRIVGPAYAAAAVKEMPRPVVAIGGITLENVRQVVGGGGVKAVAVSSAVLKAVDPGAVVRGFLDVLGK
jgi:thiamine monophosphate synthase